MSIDHIDTAKIRREQMRWIIILALYNSAPVRAFEESVLSIVQAIYPDCTRQELRREMGYVEGRDLAEITRQPDNRWLARLTRHGVDLVEYNITCEPGIARPEKYF